MKNAVIDPEYLLTFGDVEKAFMEAHVAAVQSEDRARQHATSRLLLALEEIDKDPLVKSNFEEDVQHYLAMRKGVDWNASSMETVDAIRLEASIGRFEEIVGAITIYAPAGIAVGLDEDERELLRTTLDAALALTRKRIEQEEEEDKRNA